MAKVNFRRLSGNEYSVLKSELRRTIEVLAREKEAENFLLSILTESEVVMIARRIRITKLLLKGVAHRAIADQLRVGLSTVQSVEKMLRNSGAEYTKIFPKLYTQYEKSGGKRKSTRLPPPYSFGYLRRKYPLHFLLFNLLLDEK